MAAAEGQTHKLTRDQAHRLIMAARMHGPQDFIEKIPNLISDSGFSQTILTKFEGKNATEKWNLKEKFARLHTATKDYVSNNPGEVIEVIEI